MRRKLPLAGLRILDFSWMAAGPTATQLLALNGAEVIRVEARERLDSYRRQPSIDDDPDSSYIFCYVNAGKRSVCLNLKQPTERRQAQLLAASCDVVVENFKPGTADRLGIGFGKLVEHNPNLVMVSASAAGSTGPKKHFAGYAPIFAAMGGLAYVTRQPGGPPYVYGRALDARVGAYIALAVVSGVAAQRRHGGAIYLDISGQEVVAALIGDVLASTHIHRPTRPSQTLTGCYLTRDPGEWIYVVDGDPLRSLLPEDASAEDLGRWTSTISRGEALRLLSAAGVQAQPVSHSRDIADDPLLGQRGFWATMRHPVLGQLTVPAQPIKWPSQLPPRSPLPSAPRLGADTEAVLTSLNMDKGSLPGGFA